MLNTNSYLTYLLGIYHIIDPVRHLKYAVYKGINTASLV